MSQVAMAPDVRSDDDSDSDDEEKKKHGWRVHEVSKQKVHLLHRKVFDVRRYEKLWPSIPKSELLGSCVSHPSGTYEDGGSWKWLLNTKVLPEVVTSATVSFGCTDCVRAVTGKQPRMPKYALANSLWIGRYPHVFRHQGRASVSDDISSLVFGSTSCAENYCRTSQDSSCERETEGYPSQYHCIPRKRNCMS